MKFTRYRKASPETRGGYTSQSHGRPEWLKEWIANQGRWVRLSCGCSEDLNSRTLTVVGAFKNSAVYCEKCEQFSAVVRSITVAEAMGIPAKEVPPQPLF